jgi:hypothetical protein
MQELVTLGHPPFLCLSHTAYLGMGHAAAGASMGGYVFTAFGRWLQCGKSEYRFEMKWKIFLLIKGE